MSEMWIVVIDWGCYDVAIEKFVSRKDAEMYYNKWKKSEINSIYIANVVEHG